MLHTDADRKKLLFPYFIEFSYRMIFLDPPKFLPFDNNRNVYMHSISQIIDDSYFWRST